MNINAKNGIIYALASIISQLINLFLVPLYTKNLSTIEVGRYNLATSIQSLLTILIVLGISASFIRFYNDLKDKKVLKSTTIIFIILTTMICFAFLVLGGASFGTNIFDGSQGKAYMYLVVANASLTAILNIVVIDARMQMKALRSSLILISEVSIRVMIGIYCIYVLKGDGLCLIISQIISSSIVLLIIFLKNIRNISFGFNKQYIKTMLPYGLGLLIGDLSTWILNLIDRYFLKAMSGLSQVAVYSTASKIGLLIDPVFIQPFRNVYTPIKFSIYKEKNAKDVIRKYFDIYCCIGWFCILGLGVGANIFIQILATPEYEEAVYIIPIIAFSYFLWGLVQFYSLGLHINKKTLLNSMISNVAAIVNIVLNIILIPKFNGYGAAVATCLSYAISNCAYNYFGNKEFDSGLRVLDWCKLGFVVMPLYALYKVIMMFSLNMFFEIVLIVFIIILYCVIVMKMNYIPKEYIQIFTDRVKGILKRGR